jgi:1-deoxy-D-xylulose-5-phosphate reductoisomerase
MVEFEDGSIKAQMGEPDMRTPISLAMMYPERATRTTAPFDFTKNASLTFREVDHERFPALGIAYDCLRRGGSAAATMNGANEVAVAAFLKGECRYTDIVGSIEYALAKAQFVATPSLSDYAEIDAESRRLAKEYLKL